MIVLRLAKLVAMSLAHHDLTENQYRVLAFAADGDADMSEMCLRLVMKPPNLSALIDGLVGRGLVERKRRADDRRRVAFVATPAGHAAVHAATAEADQALAGLATLGAGAASDRLEGIEAWSPAVEAAARLLRSAPDSGAEPTTA